MPQPDTTDTYPWSGAHERESRQSSCCRQRSKHTQCAVQLQRQIGPPPIGLLCHELVLLLRPWLFEAALVEVHTRMQCGD